MIIQSFEFNPLGVNTYILSDETKECLIIDPACYYEAERKQLLSYVQEEGLSVKHIILTHLHFDHYFGAKMVCEAYNLKIEVNRDDLYLLNDVGNQLKMFGFNDSDNYVPEVGNLLDEDDLVTFGNQIFTVMKIPGHSPGSLVFYNEKEKSIFVGDVLFNSSIGRSDLPGGNYDHLINGIKSKLFPLPDDTTVYPGHGPKTTIGYEKRYNPFVGLL